MSGSQTAVGIDVPIVNSYQERPDAKTQLGGGQELSESTGAMAAVQVATGKVLWETTRHQPAFGAATVSNDLVFTTLYDGSIVALERDTGKVVWEAKLPGVQLAAGHRRHPADRDQQRPDRQAEATEGGGEEAAAGGGEGEASEAMLTEGKTLFTANCSSCHTLSEAGTNGHVGPNLDELMPEDSLVETQVTNGGGGMPAFGGTLSKAEIEAVAAYVSTVAGTGNDTLGGKTTGGGGGVYPPQAFALFRPTGG